MNIQKDLKSCMDRNGWTQEKAAEATGVPQPVISRILQGKQRGVHSLTLLKLWPHLYPGAAMPGTPTDKAA
jgi:transcriptional regulator with XRE-family HTH domain